MLYKDGFFTTTKKQAKTKPDCTDPFPPYYYECKRQMQDMEKQLHNPKIQKSG